MFGGESSCLGRAMVLLRMPGWALALDCEEVDSWDQMAREQLRRQGAAWWEQYEEGDVLAVEDRTTWSEAWPGNKRFVLFVNDDQLALFSDEGWPVHDDETPEGLITTAEWDCEFASNQGDYYRIPPASSCEQPAQQPDLSVLFSAELASAEIDAQIGVMPPRDDDLGDPAVTERVAPAPEVVLVVGGGLAVRGTRVVVQGKSGVVFKVTKSHVAIALDKHPWVGYTHADFALVATPEQQMPAGAVAEVITGSKAQTVPEGERGTVKVEGFLYGKQRVESPHAWEWFDRYEPRPADAKPIPAGWP